MTTENLSAIEFDSSVYDADSIKKAAYKFIDRFSVNISRSETNFLCDISFSPDISQEFKSECIREFQKEVLDQDLRKSIAIETGSYRNAILSLAFSSTKLIQDE